MKTIKLAPGERLVTNQLNRKGVLPQNIVDAARDIVANVRANGDAAVRDYCRRFDGVELQSFRLPQEQIDAALEGLDPAFVAALEKAARQIREFHQREVEAGIDILVAQSPRAEITRASLDNEGTIVVAADMAAAVEAVNTVAPEHLELHCKDAMGLLGGIRNAGAIFVGAWSSEPLGDYVAGPNHTLPTGGTALFSHPLSVEEFVKRSSVICYTPEGLLSDAPATQRLAEAEGLWAHALSAALRRRVLEQGEDAVSAASLAAADLTKVAWPGDAVTTVAEGVDLAAAAGGAAGAVGEEA